MLCWSYWKIIEITSGWYINMPKAGTGIAPSNGMRKHRLYPTWKMMMHRCYNTKLLRYVDYGGRGIIVCDVWRDDVGKFIDDMYPSFEEGLTLDRIDNDAHYTPDNCKWSTKAEQNRNARSNHSVIRIDPITTQTKIYNYLADVVLDGFHMGEVSLVCNPKTTRKSHMGYCWRYYE